MIKGEATRSVNQERKKTLELFFAKIWEDGSFEHWVNKKTGKLNVKSVANRILNTKDASIFSKWAQPFRDDFNQRYQKWSAQNRRSEHHLAVLGTPDGNETPEVFAQEFITSNFNMLGSTERESLIEAFCICNTLAVKPLRRTLHQMENRIKELQNSLTKKERQLALQAEAIEYLKEMRRLEESHYVGSVRNLYSYDLPCRLSGDSQ